MVDVLNKIFFKLTFSNIAFDLPNETRNDVDVDDSSGNPKSFEKLLINNYADLNTKNANGDPALILVK